jgi:hypothetical protein
MTGTEIVPETSVIFNLLTRPETILLTLTTARSSDPHFGHCPLFEENLVGDDVLRIITNITFRCFVFHYTIIFFPVIS